MYKQPVDNKQLRQIIKKYYLTENPDKPLVILSIPFSGRTSTIHSVIKELDYPMNNMYFVSRHIDYCPCLLDEKVTANGKKMTFDDWIDSKLDNDSKNDSHLILEIDPNEFIEVSYDGLWGNPFLGYKTMGMNYLRALKSEKYELIPYFPSVDDWIEWARENEKIQQETINFALQNPELYNLLDYRVYNFVNTALCEIGWYDDPKDDCYSWNKFSSEDEAVTDFVRTVLVELGGGPGWLKLLFVKEFEPFIRKFIHPHFEK